MTVIDKNPGVHKKVHVHSEQKSIRPIDVVHLSFCSQN